MRNIDTRKLINSLTQNPLWNEMTQEVQIERIRIIFEGIKFLKLNLKSTKISWKGNYLSSYVKHMENFMMMKKQD